MEKKVTNANHYHKDGDNSQISLMLILQENYNCTHMRIMQNSSNSIPL